MRSPLPSQLFSPHPRGPSHRRGDSLTRQLLVHCEPQICEEFLQPAEHLVALVLVLRQRNIQDVFGQVCVCLEDVCQVLGQGAAAAPPRQRGGQPLHHLGAHVFDVCCMLLPGCGPPILLSGGCHGGDQGPHHSPGICQGPLMLKDLHCYRWDAFLDASKRQPLLHACESPRCLGFPSGFPHGYELVTGSPQLGLDTAHGCEP
mmetsp:Transcript_17521/g.30063  ORF Transcript_17521/g.30063 Transcript_17521/m.30063 type:complete len:203 (-) Transcript_17521:208-816(-)